MCLSYYEYYNKTNTSLSMLWPFLPWNICWERRNSHTDDAASASTGVMGRPVSSLRKFETLGRWGGLV